MHEKACGCALAIRMYLNVYTCVSALHVTSQSVYFLATLKAYVSKVFYDRGVPATLITFPGFTLTTHTVISGTLFNLMIFILKHAHAVMTFGADSCVVMRAAITMRSYERTHRLEKAVTSLEVLHDWVPLAELQDLEQSDTG
jgi:hypothetical protein